MTLHGVDWNSQDLRDVQWIQILLVSQQDYRAWHGFQPGNQGLQMLLQQRIIVTFGSGESETLVDAERFATMLLPQPVDRAACCYLPQPGYEVLVRIDRADAAMELQKDLLRQILRECPVHQHAKRNAVNPCLMQPDQCRKSVALTGTRGGKEFIRRAWLNFWQRKAACI